MKQRTLTIAGALVLTGAGVALLYGLGDNVPDVLFLGPDGDVALDAGGTRPTGWSSTASTPRWRGGGVSNLVVAFLPPTRMPSVVDRIRELLGIGSARQPQIFVRCDVWTIHHRPHWAAYAWSGWTDAEYAAAAATVDAVTAARERAAERIGEAAFRSLGGRAPESFQNPR